MSIVKPLLCAFLLSAGTSANALELGQPLDPGENKFGAGIHFGFASGGLSLKYRYSDLITAQGTLGFFGSLQNYGVRGLYNFKVEPDYDLYGFAGIGLWRWDGNIVLKSESVVGFGVGAGIEYTFEGIPLAASAELGLGLVNFDNYNFSSVGLGLGLHYYF